MQLTRAAIGLALTAGGIALIAAGIGWGIGLLVAALAVTWGLPGSGAGAAAGD